MNPTERFSGLAKLYDVSRPSYPMEAIEFIIAHCKLDESCLLVDVGSGTGIATRSFASRGLTVIGIEPNDDMRQTAESVTDKLVAGRKGADEIRRKLQYRKATAEDTGLDSEAVDAVISAQAFHWFMSDAALTEFHRILKPQGHVVLMWNERDDSDPFTTGYGEAFKAFSTKESNIMNRQNVGQPLLDSTLFTNAARHSFSNKQTMDLEGLLGRAFSASYAPKNSPAKEELTAALESLFNRYQKHGQVDLMYETSVYVAQK